MVDHECVRVGVFVSVFVCVCVCVCECERERKVFKNDILSWRNSASFRASLSFVMKPSSSPSYDSLFEDLQSSSSSSLLGEEEEEDDDEKEDEEEFLSKVTV